MKDEELKLEEMEASHPHFLEGNVFFLSPHLDSLVYHSHGYHAVCVQYVALSCYLSAKQMSKSKQCKVLTNEGQRLDHATKLEASLRRQCRCD